MSNIQPYDRIMLVDGQKKFNLEHNPSLEKLFSDFEICTTKELRGNEIVKKNSHEYQLDKNGLYALSPLYENLYYPLRQYNEMYQQDLQDLIRKISFYMGAKRVNFFRTEQYCYIVQQDFMAKLQADISKGVQLLNLSAEYQHENKGEERSSLEIASEQDGNGEVLYSKEELMDWIKREKIVIRGIPSFFRLHVETYLDKGKLNVNNIAQSERSEENIRNNAQLSCAISLALPCLPKFISANLDATFNASSSSEYSYLSKIRYEIEF